MDRIRDVLTEEHSVVRRELEARLAEHYFDSSPGRFNILPHITTVGLRILQESLGEVTTTLGATRGGSVIPTIHFADTAGRATEIARSAARKRLLYTRFRSWSQSNSRYPRGQIGPAGEQAVRSAILRSQHVIPLMNNAAEVTTHNAFRFDGPVDSGGWVISHLSDGQPVPVLVLVEMKNLRTWLYAKDKEVWQVLRKAHRLRNADPGIRVLPVLVCRRAHNQVRWMGQQLGFMVIETKANFLGAVPEVQAREIRSELAFIDAKVGAEPNAFMIKAFAKTVPTYAAQYADIWQSRCADPEFAEPMSTLGTSNDESERDDSMDQLITAAEDAGLKGWRLGD